MKTKIVNEGDMTSISKEFPSTGPKASFIFPEAKNPSPWMPNDLRENLVRTHSSLPLHKNKNAMLYRGMSDSKY